jgi:hypothetical protein
MVNGASVAEQTDRAKRRTPEAPDSENETSSAGSLERAERGWSVAGRALLNFALIVTLAAVLVANMPNSTLKSRLIVPAQSYLAAIGLGQSWGSSPRIPDRTSSTSRVTSSTLMARLRCGRSLPEPELWLTRIIAGRSSESTSGWTRTSSCGRRSPRISLITKAGAGTSRYRCHSCDVGQSCSRRVRHRGLVRGGSSSSTPRRWVRNEWAARAARIRMEPILVRAAGNVDPGIVPDRVRSARNLLDVIPPAQPFCLLRA